MDVDARNKCGHDTTKNYFAPLPDLMWSWARPQ